MKNSKVLDAASTRQLIDVHWLRSLDGARTLMRKLGAQSLPFRSLLDSYKLEKAISLSANPNTNLTQIALELGFRDLSSFSRAFKRWTGETPKSLFKGR